MISTNQKRNYVRIGTNLVAKASNEVIEQRIDRIVYIKNVSATGAKLESREKIADIGETITLKFKYKSTLYDILCKVVRIEPDLNQYGVQFYFKGDVCYKYNTKQSINSNKNKLNSDILEEYFNYEECFI